MRTALLLHLDDLRLTDHRPLTAALERYDRVVSVSVIDPSCFHQSPIGNPRMGARRLSWRLSALARLREAYRARGGELLIRVGAVAEEIRALAERLDACALFAQRAKTTEELQRQGEIERQNPLLQHHWIWNDTLIDPEQLPLSAAQMPKSFTHFRNKIEKRCSFLPPLPAPSRLSPPPPLPAGALPTLEAFAFQAAPIDERSPISSLEPGCDGAWRQLERYFWEGDHLRHYKETRNGMTEWSQSSKLSPYLALGLISPRSVLEELRRYEATRVANASTYWLSFELLWREYFHMLATFCGQRIFSRAGLQSAARRWRQDRALFQRWAEGETGWPMIDACMRELRESGYLSNRGRQLVASFLSKEYQVDWRWGAYHFEHHLIDYDPCSNWGNWQYVSGVGTDPRDRRFDIRRQSEIYDPKGDFVRRWLPELCELPTHTIIERNQAR